MVGEVVMSLTISLRPETEKKLQEQARAAGLDTPSYAARLIEGSLLPDNWLHKLSGDSYRKFLESGITDEQLGEELERAKHEMRAERRARNGQ
jgi:hypothetical protein